MWKPHPGPPRGPSCNRRRSRVPPSPTGRARCPHACGADPRSPVPSRAAASAGAARPPREGLGGRTVCHLRPHGPGDRRARGRSGTQSCIRDSRLPAPAGAVGTGALRTDLQWPLAVEWSPAQARAQPGTPTPTRILMPLTPSWLPRRLRSPHTSSMTCTHAPARDAASPRHWGQKGVRCGVRSGICPQGESKAARGPGSLASGQAGTCRNMQEHTEDAGTHETCRNTQEHMVTHMH